MAKRVAVDLPPGLKSEDTSYSTQGSYRTGDKIRFIQNRAEVTKGWESVSFDNIPGIVRNLLQWKDKIQAPLIALGSNSHLYVWRSGTNYDITPPDYLEGSINGRTSPGYGLGGWGLGPWGTYTGQGNYRTSTWSLSNFGQSMIATPRRGSIYWWQNNTSVRADILASIADSLTESGDPGSAHVPEFVDHTVVTSGRQIIAFGCNEEYGIDANGSTIVGGVFNPLNVRGSDVDGNIVVWNVDDSNLSFEVQLEDSGASYISAVRMWNDLQIAVWTDTGMFKGIFTGDPGGIYDFNPIPAAAGACGPNAVALVGDTAYYISNDFQLWMCPISGSPQMIESPIHSETLANIPVSQNDKVVMTHITSTGEIRIDYPHSADGLENSRYVSLHIASGAWSQGTMSRTSFISGNQFPVGATSSVQLLPNQGVVLDNESASTALRQAQKATPSISGDNIALRANTAVSAHVAVQDIPFDNSGWGFVYVGNSAADAYGDVQVYGANAGSPYSVSFDAKIIDGPPEVLAQIEFYSTASGYEAIQNTTVVFDRTLQRFHLDGVYLPTNTTNTTVRVGFFDTVPKLGDGVRVNVTDIKVQQSLASTGWTPNPTDPDLYDDYAVFIRELRYLQTISNFYYHERGNTADGGTIDWSLETNLMALDEDYTNFLISRFVPDFINQIGPISVVLEFRQFPQDPDPITVGPMILMPGQEKLDFTIAGKLVKFTFSAANSPASCRFGRPMFDLTPLGTR